MCRLSGVVLEPSGCFLPLAAEPLPVRRSLGEGGSTAAACLPAPRSPASKRHEGETSPPQTRARGFRCTPSGRKSGRGRFHSMFTPHSSTCVYKDASGQANWPNRDPLGEEGGINLYGYTMNDPVNWSDSDGRAIMPPMPPSLPYYPPAPLPQLPTKSARRSRVWQGLSKRMPGWAGRFGRSSAAWRHNGRRAPRNGRRLPLTIQTAKCLFEG